MQTRKFIITAPTGILMVLLCLGAVSYALPDDKNKPIHLSSDSADLNQSAHRGEYIGNVHFRQGTSRIAAQRALTIVDEHNKLTEAIAYGTIGSRAHFSTLTDIKKPRMHAQADIIRYFPKKHLIELEGHAKVTQGQDRFEGDIIRYDTLKQHVLSNSKGNQRTLIVINSDKIK